MLHPYAEGVSNPLRSVLDEPRPSAPPARVWRDWALLGLVTVCAALEWALREDLPLPRLSVVLTVGLASLLLWRRTHPLAVVATAFGVTAVVDIVLIAIDAQVLDMYSMVYFLLLPYALFRWGSGREAVTGLAIILVPATLALVRQLARRGRRDRRGRRPDGRLRPGLGRALPGRRPRAAGWSR